MKPNALRDEVSPKKFGDSVTGDHIDCSGDGLDKGVNGEKYGFVLYDRATGWLDTYPVTEKTAENIQAAMDDFCGPRDRVVYFYSDGGRELIKAVCYMGWTHGLSTPGRPETNGVAETQVRRVLQMARTLLEHVGLSPNFWPYAAKAACFEHNISGDEDSSYYK